MILITYSSVIKLLYFFLVFIRFYIIRLFKMIQVSVVINLYHNEVSKTILHDPPVI